MGSKKAIRGFTLIELVITLSVIAILARLAYPNYIEYLRTSRRADAQGALEGLAQAMERNFTTSSTYRGMAAGGGDTGAPAIYSATAPVSGGTPTYNLSITAASATSFAIQATPTGAQLGDKCGSLTLSSTGQRGITGAKPGITVGDCWRG